MAVFDPFDEVGYLTSLISIMVDKVDDQTAILDLSKRKLFHLRGSLFPVLCFWRWRG